ncbi:hypothetical protein N0V85_009741, partial [Neurospora sp. IMI 360204]
MLTLSCIATFLTAYTAGAYSPPQRLLLSTLAHAHSSTAILGGISTFCLGFALAPMVLAPFSEMNGRQPVFVVAGVVFVIFQAVCGVVETLEGMLVARFFLGVGASVFSTMVGGVIADIWTTEERNTPMAMFSMAVMCGTGLGPLVSAYMTQRWGMDEDGEVVRGNGARWKWIFWHQVILGGALMAALVVLFRESRGSVLLSRKARALNRWYEELEAEGFFGVWVDEMNEEEGNGDVAVDDEEKKGASSGSTTKTLRRIRWKTKDDEERGSLTHMISTSVVRPFHLLFTEPVVFFFSLWAAFAWGVLYLTFGSIPLVFRTQYGWNIEQAGRIFVAMIVGAILATAIGIWQEKMLHHPNWRRAAPSSSSSSPETTSASDTEGPNALSSSEPKTSLCTSSSGENPIWPFLRTHFPTSSPEARLYFTCLTATFLPIGLFIFGFTARPDYHWIGPAIGIGIATMGILSVYLAVFNYLADTYHR